MKFHGAFLLPKAFLTAAFLSATILATFFLGCSSGSNSTPASAKPPLDAAVVDQYGGQKYTYTSPDGSCVSSVELYSSGTSQMTVQDSGPCPVLFGETFPLNCYSDKTCSGRLAKYASTVTLSLDGTNSVTFTRRNDVEQVDHVTTYQLDDQLVK